MLLFVQYLGVCKCGVLLVAFVYVLSDFVALSRCCCVWPVAVCTSFVFILAIIEGTTFPTSHTFVFVGTVGFCVS